MNGKQGKLWMGGSNRAIYDAGGGGGLDEGSRGGLVLEPIGVGLGAPKAQGEIPWASARNGGLESFGFVCSARVNPEGRVA